MPEPTINDMMEAYALDAVDYVKANFGVELDFSNDSIKELETVAGQLYDSIPRSFFSQLFKKAPGQEEIDAVCKLLGGYLGEVYRRNKPGDWGIHEEFNAIGICHEDRWLFPPTKVYKRLTNGEEDNLHSFFTVALSMPWSANDS